MSVDGPARFVDPASGAVLIRFINERPEEVGVLADLTITGTVQ